MSANGLLALAATLASAAFLVGLVAQHRRRPRPSSFAWLVGLACFTIAVALQTLAELGGLTPLLYRLWYLAGAFFAAAYLGMGSLYLALPARAASWTMRGLAWASLLVTPTVLTAPLELDRVDPRLLTGAAFPEYVRLLTPLFNVFGTVGLVGVALWSAARLVRRGGDDPADRRRFWSVALIAVGALVAASGSTLLRFGVPGGFYLSQLVGVLGLWAGFAIGSRAPAPSRDLRRVAHSVRP